MKSTAGRPMVALGLAVLALLVVATTATTEYVLTHCRLPVSGAPVVLPIPWLVCAPEVTAVVLPTFPVAAVPTAEPTGTLAPTPPPVPTDTQAPELIVSPTQTLAPQPTDSPTPSPTPTSSPTASPTSSPTPTATPSPRPTRTRTPTPVATLNPQGHVGLGVYELASPYDDLAAVQQFEALLKHKMEYVLWFQAWGDSDRDFASQWIKMAAQKGLIPVITWEPWKRAFDNPAAIQPDYSLQSIAAGEHDDYIRTWARSAKSLGIRFIIRFAHEQSTEPGTRSWYPWQGDPEGYKSAFRHIVAIFREEGATQVQFLWSGMWLNEWASQYYPGDDVVDFVGTTAINHGTAITADWAKWRSFDELFSGQYDAAQQWNKPIIVTELATAEQGGSKASWLRDCFLAMKPRYPLVQGLILFEVPVDREWPSINWSVSSSSESLAAVREAIADPYFK